MSATVEPVPVENAPAPPEEKPAELEPAQEVDGISTIQRWCRVLPPLLHPRNPKSRLPGAPSKTTTMFADVQRHLRRICSWKHIHVRLLAQISQIAGLERCFWARLQ